MGSLSDVIENEMLDHVLGLGVYTTPGTIYLALSTADFLDDGSGAAEPVAMGYIRKAISFGVAAARVSTQDAIVQYDEATGTWGDITHWAIFSLESAGVMLAHGALSATQNIVSGNTPSVASGQITITASTGGMSDYLAEEILNHLFDATAYTPEGIYVALCSVAIADADDGTTITELAMTGYAREAKLAGATDWDAAVGDGVTANASLIDFGVLSSTGETCEAICLVNNATTALGEVLFYDNSEAQAIADGDTVQMIVGAFDITMD